MKNLILLVLMLTSSFSLIAQTPQLQLEWTSQFNNTVTSYDNLLDMEIGQKGIYVAGGYYENPFFTQEQIQIVKYLEDGTIDWVRTNSGLDSTKSKWFNDLQLVDETMLYVSATVGGNPTVHVLLAKYNIAGDLIWMIEKDAIHPGTPFTYKFQVTKQGNIYLIYDQGGTYPTQGVHIVKLNANAQVIWEKNFSYNSTSLDYLNEFNIDDDENIYLLGATSQYDSVTHGFTNPRIFYSKFDSTGQVVWQQRYNQLANYRPHKIIFDTSQNMYISVQNSVGVPNDFFLSKIDSSGFYQLIHDFSMDTTATLLKDFFVNNNYIYTFNTSNHINDDWIFISKYNLNGNFLLQSDTLEFGSNEATSVGENGNSYLTFSTPLHQNSTYVIDSQGLQLHSFHNTNPFISYMIPQKVIAKNNGSFYVGALSAQAFTYQSSFCLMKYNYTDTTNNYVIINTEPIEKEKINVQLYPNPVTNISNIKIDLEGENTRIQIVNALGQVMPKPLKISNQHFEIHQENYPAGIYFYTIQADNELIYSSSFQVY